MLWIPAALIGCYAVFVIGPAIAAVCTIFKAKPGSDFDTMLQPGGQFAPYAERMRAARDCLHAHQAAQISTRSRDGLTLSGTYYGCRAPCTAILVHGYRTQPEVNFAVQADAFLRHGYNVLLIRQRGHEPGSHVHCGLGLYERYDVAAWNDWALSQNGVSETVLYGISMGAASVGFAADALDPVRTRALVLDCGFRSPDEQIRLDCRRRNVPGFLLMPWIRLFARVFLKLRIRERTDEALGRTTIPCFFLHGTEDRTVPYEIGRAVYEACGTRKAFFTADGVGHAEAFLPDPARAEEALFRFLEGGPIEGNQQQEDI